MDEAALIDKLLRIEALHSGATTDGERQAARHARDRIMQRLRQAQAVDPPLEYRFSLHDPWERRLFIALARRYDLRPFRYKRQHRATIMVKAPQRFVDETLWPQFQALAAELRRYLDDVTSRVISTAIHADSSEADEDDVRQLPSGK